MTDTYEKPQGYIPRIVDAQVERYLGIFGAIEITGTKWCGKTWTALQHAASVSYLDQNLALAKSDPSMMLMGDQPHVIDEWQLVPPIWDTVRHEVDSQRKIQGSYILTGSSTPFGQDTQDQPLHSGAGRIGRIRMHPMSLAESGDSTGDVSLSALFEGHFEPCVIDKNTLGLVEVACRGGWPEAIDMPSQDAQIIAREYINSTLNKSIPKLKLDSDTARRILSSLARNLGQSATYLTISADMYPLEDSPHKAIGINKIAEYLRVFKNMFLIEEVPGWAPPARSRKRFITKSKRYLADPSLATALLGLNATGLLDDWQTFGLVFENMCIRDLSVYARSLDLLDNTPVRYYRDDSGLETDAIVELADGRWAAFEFKVGEDKAEQGIATLKHLRKKLLENPRSRIKPPSFMAVITGNGQYARQVEDGIFVIPLRALGA